MRFDVFVELVVNAFYAFDGGDLSLDRGEWRDDRFSLREVITRTVEDWRAEVAKRRCRGGVRLRVQIC